MNYNSTTEKKETILNAELFVRKYSSRITNQSMDRSFKFKKMLKVSHDNFHINKFKNIFSRSKTWSINRSLRCSRYLITISILRNVKMYLHGRGHKPPINQSINRSKARIFTWCSALPASRTSAVRRPAVAGPRAAHSGRIPSCIAQTWFFLGE